MITILVFCVVQIPFAIFSILAYWHGYRIEIGKKGMGTHIVMEQKPLKDVYEAYLSKRAKKGLRF